MSKKVLILAYYWPPSGGVAVQRFLKFSKYLPEFGWEPIIVTVNNGSYPYYDESLLKEVPASLRVYRTKTFEPFELYNLLLAKKGKSLPVASVSSGKSKSFFQTIAEYIRANYFIPDARKGWVPYAVEQAEKLIKEEKIEAVITTGPPHSTHLAGLQLKQKLGVKWIADFRDPWSKILYNKFLPRTASTISKDQKLEATVLQNADRVIMIGKSLAEEFAVPVNGADVIYNGYDEEDFKGEARETEGCFTMRYIGNWLATENSTGLFKALKRMLDTNAEFKKYFKLELTGRAEGLILDQIKQYGLEPWFANTAFVAHSEAIQLMRGANILLLLIPDVPGGKAIMTGKMFEYIAACNPVLGFGEPDGEASELMKQIDRESFLSYNNDKAAEAFIEKYFNLWLQNKKRFQYSGEKYRSLSRKELTRKLAELLNTITL